MSCNCVFKWKFEDVEATDFERIVEGAQFSIHLDPGGPSDQVLYCTADSFISSDPSSFFCRVFSDPERTQEITAGNFTGLNYRIDWFEGWTWSSADLFGNVDVSRIGSWRSNTLMLCVDGGRWDGEWIAIPNESQAIEYTFDGEFTRHPMSVTGLMAQIVGGTLPAGTYSYNVSAVDSTGKEGAASLPVTLVLSSTGGVDLSWNPVAGATSYNVYQNCQFLANVTDPTVTYVDDGSVAPQAQGPRLTPEPGIDDPVLTVVDGVNGVTVTIDPADIVTSTNDNGYLETKVQVTGIDDSGNEVFYERTEVPRIQPDINLIPEGWDGTTPITRVIEQVTEYDQGTDTWTITTTDPEGNVEITTITPDEICVAEGGLSGQLSIEVLYDIDGGSPTWGQVLNLDGVSSGFPSVGSISPTALGQQLTFPVDVNIRLVNPQDVSDTPMEVFLFHDPDPSFVGVPDLSNPSKPGPITVQLPDHATDVRVFQNFGPYQTSVEILFDTGGAAPGLGTCEARTGNEVLPERPRACRFIEKMTDGSFDSTFGTWRVTQSIETFCHDGVGFISDVIIDFINKTVEAFVIRPDPVANTPGAGPPANKVIFPDPHINRPSEGSVAPFARPGAPSQVTVIETELRLIDSVEPPSESVYLEGIAGNPQFYVRPAVTEPVGGRASLIRRSGETTIREARAGVQVPVVTFNENLHQE